MPEFGFFKPSAHDPDSKTFLDANTGEWFTRAQLSRQVTDFAERLRFQRKAFGFHFGFNDSAGLIAYLGAIESGHAVVTLDPEMDPGLKSKLIALFEPDFLIGPESHRPEDRTGYAPSDPPHVGQFLWRARDAHRHPIHADLTLLLSTSGSTGSPKLVRLAWRNLEASARQINHALRNTERDRAMVTAPIFNAYGQSVVHTHLLAGASFVLTRDRVISREFWNTVRDSGCNSIGGTPYFYEALDRLDLESLDVPLLTKFIATGGRLPEHMARKFHFAAAKRGGAMHLIYISFIPQYIFILLVLITIDYSAGLLIERAQSARARKTWLALSLIANLGLMFAFKYSPDVFGRSFGAIPVGLSFHTFQAMAYTIEVYRGRQAAERLFTVYALYVMFFPQIAAGPIERPQDLLPQFRKPRAFNYATAVSGLQLMAWGMFQKYVVADRLSLIVNALYADRLSGPAAAFAAACFSFQIFCDFAGYSDIALGAAEVLGIRLTRNFNSPFHADSMAEYWKRWHISLSSWMRDYVFFPLCGRRPRMPRICGSIMVVFLANALWHGARWNYMISGLLHGTYRVTELLGGRAMSRAGWSVSPVWARPVKLARTVLVFSLMTFAFLFFRGESLTQTLGVVSRVFCGWTGSAHPSTRAFEWADAGLSAFYVLNAIVLIAIVEAVQWVRASGPLRPRIAALPVAYRWSVYYAAAAILLFGGESSVPFIYFQF